jgi:voltage-gated sodium channel
MKDYIKRIFLNDHFVLGVILLNTVVIYVHESGVRHPVVFGLDIACTLFFVVEMVIKHLTYGAKSYWQDGWNRMDGILVIISLPSLVTPFIDAAAYDFSILLTLRLLRVLRAFRVFHFFPKIVQIGAGLKRAVRSSGVVLIGFFLLLLIFGMINCSLYGEVVPQYFDTPLNATYSVFRVFTVEGWYEIPDAIMEATSPLIGRLSRLYFCFLLGAFGLLGMSFINSVFVDAMMADNNDDMKYQLDRIERRLEEMEEKLDKE